VSDLVTVAAPDGRVREVDGPSGIRYQSRDGLYRMLPADAAALRAVGGFAPNIGGRTTRGGYRCTGCGFGSFFRRCSRCNTDTCEKE
jgi:hypothetical protein